MKLMLYPERRDAPWVTVALHHGRKKLTVARALDRQQGQACVRTNSVYSIAFDWEKETPPVTFRVRLNGDWVSDNELWRPKLQRRLNRPDGRTLFCDCYGYAALEIVCQWPNGNRTVLTSDFMEVEMPDSEQNENVRRMAEYVSRLQSGYLQRSGLTDGGAGYQQRRERSPEATLKLLEQIAEAVQNDPEPLKKSGYGPGEMVHADFSRMDAMSPAALRSIATHPEQLYPVAGRTGIAAAGLNWAPRKVLCEQRRETADTPVNRALLSFLYTAASAAAGLEKQIREWAQAEEEKQEGYYRSSAAQLQASMAGYWERLLPKAQKVAVCLSAQCRRMHSRLPGVPLTPLKSLPPLTTREAGPQGEKMWKLIRSWFGYGSISPVAEQAMLSLLLNHRLYEYYAMIRLCESLVRRGWSFLADKSTRCEWPSTYNADVAVEHHNLLCFEKNGERLDIFFQPAVYPAGTALACTNGLNLVRNTGFALDKDGSGKVYSVENVSPYTPDYVLRLRNDSGERLLIVDAKFKSGADVWSRDLTSLMARYLFSISPVNGATHAGVAALYGKDASGQPQSAHTLAPAPHLPPILILPVSAFENGDEKGIDCLLDGLLAFENQK